MNDAPALGGRDPEPLETAGESDPTGTGASLTDPTDTAADPDPAFETAPHPPAVGGALPEPGADDPTPRPPVDEKVMPLVDHLGELRRRVAISLLAVVLAAAVGFMLAPQIIKLLISPLPNQEVVFLTLSGGFLVWMRISLVFGLLVALPVVLYQLWAFVAPGLTPDERRATLP